MNPLEKAYKAWRATLPPVAIIGRDPIVQEIVSKMYGEKPRKYAGTGKWKRTAWHREIARKAAKKRWAKVRRRA